MRIETIHLRDTDGRPYCGVRFEALLITTSDRTETTCYRCLGVHASGRHPLTTREMAGLISLSVAARSRLMETATEWRSRQKVLVEAQHRAFLALEQLHSEIPWWCLRERRMLTRTIKDVQNTIHSR